MAIKITMPQLGESVSEGVVGKWLKREGERVERDEPLVEVITDKVNAEIPAVSSGVLLRISVAEGETVAVGTEIAVIEEAEGGQPRPEARGQQPLTGVHEPPAAPAPAEAEHPGNGVRTSPLVRRLAQEHGVDLAQIAGTGLHGRVTKEDILGFIAGGQASTIGEHESPPQPRAAAPGAGPAGAAASGGEAVKVPPLRRMIAEHMVQSTTTVPHATTFVEVDMTALVKRRSELREDFARREGVELTYLPFVIQAAAEALRQVPSMNAEWAGETIILKREVNVGFAVSVDGGLVVPVIRDAPQYSIAGLAHKIRELSDKARAGKLALDDVHGGTFTVNNPGVFGTVLSMPIINAPQAGILTMDAVVKRPVVVEGDAIAVRSMMYLGLAFDHRVNDGLAAARFLTTVRDHLQTRSPALV